MADPWVEGSLTLHCPGCGVSEQVRADSPWGWLDLEERTAPFFEAHRACPEREAPDRKLFTWNNVPASTARGYVIATVCASSAGEAVELVYRGRTDRAEKLPVSEERLALLREAEYVREAMQRGTPEVLEAQPWIPLGVLRDFFDTYESCEECGAVHDEEDKC